MMPGPFSVIQGSKMLSLLYTIYVNEIPIIHKLLENKEMMNIMMDEDPTKTSKIEHEVQQFIDDSNSTITFDDPTDAKEYLNKYFQLLKIFYNASKLQLNDDKTNLMVINSPALEVTAKTIILETEKETVKEKNHLKILGWIQS